ncbi:hypothetical protein NUW58_g4281 [Xylaria curta]|uniref:Uncharacterized protein n=1 Tax=Xylaria curta TaxID=42375 RepID=A0ACC1P8G6_9PEZI|nr:hypothetical protein NUW58_g4281 [Xylaria curta]
MSPARRLLPPSSSLPAIRSLNDQSEPFILDALGNLHALYCPLPTSLAFQTSSVHKELPVVADSGYASDNDEDSRDDEETLELRDDPYERSFAERWLTGFLGRAEELMCFESEESRQRAIDKASCVLASFFGQDSEEAVEDTEITRDYHFTLNLDSCEGEGRGHGTNGKTITVRLTDGLAGKDNTDHTDVGLQSWGAAFIFTELMCANPARLDFTKIALGSTPRIIELGAGTGLVGIALGRILPPLGSIQENGSTLPSIVAAPLDWQTPDLSPPLHNQADVLVATDVIYGPEHALWLRDCAARMLKPDGVFWLMLTVRTTGKFEGISETMRASFNGRDGLRNPQGYVLAIIDEERFARPRGIGRGDESEYRLFRIGWAS